jgi:hypothetical protein
MGAKSGGHLARNWRQLQERERASLPGFSFPECWRERDGKKMPSNWSLCADAAAPTRLDDVLILKPLFRWKKRVARNHSLSLCPCRCFLVFSVSGPDVMENPPALFVLLDVRACIRWGCFCPDAKCCVESEEINQGGERPDCINIYTDTMRSTLLDFGVHSNPGQMLNGKERRKCCRANKRRKDVSLLDKTFNISRAMVLFIWMGFFMRPRWILCIAHFAAASVCLSV